MARTEGRSGRCVTLDGSHSLWVPRDGAGSWYCYLSLQAEPLRFGVVKRLTLRHANRSRRSPHTCQAPSHLRAFALAVIHSAWEALFPDEPCCLHPLPADLAAEEVRGGGEAARTRAPISFQDVRLRSPVVVKNKRLCQWQSRSWAALRGCCGSEGRGRQQALAWLPGIGVFTLGGPVVEEAISRSNIHAVDVG